MDNSLDGDCDEKFISTDDALKLLPDDECKNITSSDKTDITENSSFIEGLSNNCSTSQINDDEQSNENMCNTSIINEVKTEIFRSTSPNLSKKSPSIYETQRSSLSIEFHQTSQNNEATDLAHDGALNNLTAKPVESDQECKEKQTFPEHIENLASQLNECKLSSSSDSLYSDTFLENLGLEGHMNCDNTENEQHLNTEPTNEYSDDASESLSEQDYEFESENTVNHIMKRHKYEVKRSGPEVEYYKANRKFMESNNKKLVIELTELKSKLNSQENEHRKQITHLRSEFEAKLSKLLQTCEILKKEKEAMVIRYANSEKEVILIKKAQADLEKKLKETNKDRDNLTNKIKSCAAEKQRLLASLDQKSFEFLNLLKDHEKLKEDMSCKDIKIKWVQNKLKTETESHKETKIKLEHNIQRLQEKREEAEQVRRDCQEMIRRYQEAEEIKSVKLDHQLKQKLSELEVQKQERSDQEEVYQLVRQELEALKKKQRITIEENNNLTLKIHGLEKERLEYEQTLCKLKDNQNSLKQEIVDLTARLAEMQNLELQLDREKEKVAACTREVERLRQTNAELQADMDACHMKEGELLEFTQRLTAKTVDLQSEHSLLESKAQALEEEITQLNKQNSDMEQKISDLILTLEEEKKQRQEETHLLARKLAEKSKTVEQLTVKLEESDNENKVMKRRHITSIKELSRELHQYRKRLEAFEINSSCPPDATSLGSRASSSASLDNITNPNSTVASAPVSSSQISPQVVFSGGRNNSSQSVPIIPQEVDQNMLIERIVKLQKLLAKKNDKIEFLEDHNMQLIKEVKKKSKIIQSYVVKEETGALVSNKSDQNKLDLSKRGGIMASVYSSHLADNNMTLDLSLEINQKLQAVLEDTLLKNITLKENISTLGEEIARLTAEKKDINRQLTKFKNLK